MAYDLKNEEDVKEYLDKLGTEYRFNCFSEGKPEGCELLGEYLETVKSDYEKAMKVFKSNCDNSNFPRSCYKYALLALRGKGPKTSHGEAYSYLEKACRIGHSDSCTTGGIIMMETAYKAAEITDKNTAILKRGSDLLSLGCELNHPLACFYYSSLFINGLERIGIPQSMETSFQLAEKSCRLGHAQGCANLSQMYTRGEGVQQDKVKGKLLETQASELRGDGRQPHNILHPAA